MRPTKCQSAVQRFAHTHRVGTMLHAVSTQTLRITQRSTRAMWYNFLYHLVKQILTNHV